MERKTELKEHIRKNLKRQRAALDERGWQERTEAAVSILTGLDCFRKALKIYCYVDIGREVGTRKVIWEAWKLGKQVFVPKVKGRQMRFYELTDMGKLSPGAWGIPEPEEGKEGNGEEGLIVVPGVAFDQRLNRLGYGGGFYDRFLLAHPGLLSVGLAFELQVLDRLPAEPFDQPVKILATEKGVRTASQNGIITPIFNI